MNRFAAIAAAEKFGQDYELLGQQLAAEVEKRFLEKLRSRERPTSRATNRASSLGDPCLRRMVLHRTRGEEAKPIDDVGLAVFRFGHMIEGPIRREIEDLGFEVEKSQMSFPPNDFRVSGHIDGMLKHHRAPVKAILEIKGYAGPTWKSINSIDDMREHARSWIQKAASQGAIYAVLADMLRWDEDDLPIIGALFVLVNKWTGEWKTIFGPLDYEEGQRLLEKSMDVEAHVAEKTLPEYIDDRGECVLCPFFPHVCRPELPEAAGEIRVVLKGEPEHADLVAALETMHNGAGTVKDVKEADEFLFGKAGRLRGVAAVVVQGEDDENDWHIRGAWSPHTTYKIPEDRKPEFKHTDPQGTWRKTVELIRRTA